jgi:nucleotide-binding universal stress UspA family protein
MFFFILPEKQLIMPLIITATDFSDTGTNAVNYACQLATAQQAQLVIIHSYMIPIMFSDVPMPATIVDDAQHDSEEQMIKLVAEMEGSYPGLDIKGKIVYGDIIDAIEEFTEENVKPWVVVIGNSSSREDSSWPDSTLIEALKTLKYPVIAVPPIAAYHPIGHICFAFDNKHSGHEAALQQVTELTKQLNAQLHVLHALPDIQNPDHNPDVDIAAQKILAPANPHYHTVFGNHTDQTIQTFNEENNMDLLIMIPHKYSFFQGLFHQGHTKAIVHNSRIPILALHDAHA